MKRMGAVLLMKKTVLAMLLCAALLFAAGCGGDYPELEAVDLAGMELETGVNGAFAAQFPAGEWLYDVSSVPTVDFAVYDLETMGSETGTMNLNALISGDMSGKLRQSHLDALLENLEDAEMAGMEIKSAEMRSLNGEPVMYVENETTVTEELLDFYIENSGITGEQLAAMGGREALLNIPPTRQIQLYGVVEEKIIVVSGTYYDDASKARLLTAMTIVLQTADVK